MSTRELRKLVENEPCTGDTEACLHCAALAEVEAIERAAKIYVKRQGDMLPVDGVMESIAKDAP